MDRHSFLLTEMGEKITKLVCAWDKELKNGFRFRCRPRRST